MVEIKGHFWKKNDTPTKKIVIISTRIVVASVESMSLTPILPKIVTKAAKKAERIAKIIQ